LGIGAPPLGLVGESLDALHQYPPVPGPVEDREVAGLGNPGPEAPQVMVRRLIALGSGDGNDRVAARIEAADHPLDRAALAGGVPPLAGDDHRAPLLEAAILERGQPRL